MRGAGGLGHAGSRALGGSCRYGTGEAGIVDRARDTGVTFGDVCLRRHAPGGPGRL